jgi:hypothetical protein
MYVLAEKDYMHDHYTESEEHAFLCDVEVPLFTKEQLAEKTCIRLDRELAELEAKVARKQKQLAELGVE